MKIMITGSSGFIGKELIKHLGNKHEIIEYDLEDEQNILDFNKLKEAMKGCSVVIHLAAYRKPYEDKTFNDYFEVNCKGTYNIVEAAFLNKVRRIIFTSSTSYYGIEKGIPFLTPIKESNLIMTQHVKVDNLNTRDCDIAYSTSKVISEQILANYGLTKKIEVVILRLGPTRKRGEYRPFGKINLHLKIENALQAIEASINIKKRIWYEYFTITDENKNVDLSKAKKLLNYIPQ